MMIITRHEDVSGEIRAAVVQQDARLGDMAGNVRVELGCSITVYLTPVQAAQMIAAIDQATMIADMATRPIRGQHLPNCPPWVGCTGCLPREESPSIERIRIAGQ